FLDPAKLIEQRRDAFGRGSERPVQSSSSARSLAQTARSSNVRRKLTSTQFALPLHLACADVTGTDTRCTPFSGADTAVANAALPAPTTITSWSGVKVLPLVYRLWSALHRLGDGDGTGGVARSGRFWCSRVIGSHGWNSSCSGSTIRLWIRAQPPVRE